MSNNGNQNGLHHKLITLPQGKSATDVIGERHDIILLFDATKANPNGDPDAGNMPRLQPDSLKGLVTDVCLKRKVRNFFSLYTPDGNPAGNAAAIQGYDIFIRENAVLQKLMESPKVEEDAKKIFVERLGQELNLWKKKEADEQTKRAYRDALCKLYFDLRTFGGVISTEGPLKGSFYGQVRGPVQFTFAESLDRILQLDATITRCAVASEKEQKPASAESEDETGNRTMGRKFLVDYGLYRAHIYVSAAFAHKTGFTYYDLDNFLFALKHIFQDDNAAGRSGLRVVGLIDFQHATCLGNAPAHKLFEKVVVDKKDQGQEFPGKLEDYHGKAPANGALITEGEGENQRTLVTVNQLIWEIPKKPITEEQTVAAA